MTRTDKLLAKMEKNPQGWRIEDLEAVAARLDIGVRKHGGGSHVIFTCREGDKQLSVPAHKPVKPVYVRKFLKLANATKE